MSKARILVVEDERIIAEDIRISLTDMGYDVCSLAATGEQAIENARTQRPDLVLMDIVLQGPLDGIDTASIITEKFAIPIIYLTAYADDKILDRAKITQPFGYLVKPFRDRELCSSIEMALLKHDFYRRLEENERWLQVILNGVGDALIAADENGRIKFINPVAELITGWKRDEAQGAELNDVFVTFDEPGQKGNATTEELMQRIEQGRNSYSALLQSRSGRFCDIEVTVSPIRESGGQMPGLVLVFRDVSERNKRDYQLRLFSEAVAQSSEGIAVFDLEYRIVVINKAYAGMHGYDPQTIIGKHISLFYDEEQFVDIYDSLRSVIRKNNWNAELTQKRLDGSTFSGLVRNSVLRNAHGAIIGIIGTLQDISDIKAAQESLAAYSSSLEAKVEERTRDLEDSKEKLRKYSESLENTNDALKLIIETIDEQKKDLEKKILHNFKLTIWPIIEQLKTDNFSETKSLLLSSLEFNLSNMFSSFGFNMIKSGKILTPKEVRICEMVRTGLSSKQIAKLMDISPQTVLVHRRNIRRKLALGKSGQNLASYLKANL